MDLVVARERLADCMGELVELGRQHHTELAAADYEFQPDLAKFQAREDAGELRVFTLRETHRAQSGDSYLTVGYTVLYVQPNPHGNETIAVEGLVYVHPSFRGHGLRLMRESDRLLAEEGVNRVFRTVCLTAERDHGLCLARLGYAPKEQTWCRKLEASVPPAVRQDAPDFVESPK